jgi:4a-hydroxytetrahydrobiopterin dehydratase
MARVSEADIQGALAALVGWARVDNEIVKIYDCSSFAEAISFVVHIGFLAEHAQHHPDLDIRYRKVKVALTTHDAGGLTEKDLELARRIEEVAP